VDGELKDLGSPLTRPCRVEILTFKRLRRSKSCATARPTSWRPPCRSSSRHQGHHRPGHRQRLLLRFRHAQAGHRGRSAGHREAHGRTGRQGDAFTRRELSAGEAAAHFEKMGESYKVEIIRDLKAPAVSCYRVGGFETSAADRTCSTAARPGLQAAVRGRGLLEGRRTQQDADAHLRHGLRHPGRTGRLPETGGGGQEARPPPHRQGPRPLQFPGGGRPGPGVLASQGRHGAQADRGLLAR